MMNENIKILFTNFHDFYYLCIWIRKQYETFASKACVGVYRLKACRQ